MFKKFVILSAMVLAAFHSHAADLYVSPEGSDKNSGTKKKPFASLAAARDAARQYAGREPVEIVVGGGNYYLDKPLILTAADSGTKANPVIWRVAKGADVRLVGGKPLQLKWEKHNGNIFKASVPEGTEIHQLFLNGKRQILARYPNYNPKERILCGAAPTRVRMKNWKNPETAYIHGIAHPNWGSAHAVIKRNEAGELYEYLVAIDTTTPGNRGSISLEDRFAENVFEELDAPKEWFFDEKTLTLYFRPENPASLKDGLVEAISNAYLIRMEGDAKAPVKHITFDGFLFSGAAPTWKLTQDHLPNGGDFVVHRGGALFFDGTEDCAIRNSDFIELDGNAVFINGYNRRTTVENCLIRNVGANGIAICGAKETMRGEQFFKPLDKTITNRNGVVRQKWEYPKGWYELPKDLTPGPKTENYPSECLIKGNLITVSGEIEKQTAGVLLSMTRRNTISYNTIHHVPRAGICMNDNSWSGNIIEHNDVFNTVRETADHGAFNSWGKDRYWRWANHVADHAEPEKLQKYCRIDAMEPNHIRNNRFAHLRAGRSWGIDLDDGSTNFKVYNNLTLGCSIKFREGMHRTTENNIFIAGINSPGRQMSMPESQDVFRNNIVVSTIEQIMRFASPQPQGMKESDYNCFFTTLKGEVPIWVEKRKRETIKDRRKNVKQELHSIVADPMFVDPANGDYRVKPESPALKLGFKNFPMKFGVTEPRLTKLLPKRTFVDVYSDNPTPYLDVAAKESNRSDRVEVVMGCEMKNMTDETEKSVVGAGEMTGVLIVTIIPDTPIGKAGMQEGELIIGCNGKAIKDLNQLNALLNRMRTGEIAELEVYNDSKEVKYKVAISEKFSIAPDVLRLPMPKVKARYVRVELPGEKRQLVLTEVEVMVGGENIAVGKKAKQSSNYKRAYASYAVDGRVSIGANQNTDKSATATQISANPWWEVDLGAMQDITTIKVYNWRGPGKNRLQNFSLKCLDDKRRTVFEKTGIRAHDAIEFGKE